MKRNALPLAMVFALAACAERGPLPTPWDRLAPGGRANVLSVGEGPLVDGACTRDLDKPVETNFTFTADSGSVATLDVTDNGVLGLNGTLTLNGEVVVSHPMLGDGDPVDVAVPVTLLAENHLVCRLEGKPGSGLAFQVTP